MSISRNAHHHAQLRGAARGVPHRANPGKAIKELAGHASYSTADRSVHLFDGAKQAAIALLETQIPSGFGD